MSDFVIPKGTAFAFSLNIMEKDSFLPQDLTSMLKDTTTPVIKIFDLVTGECVLEESDSEIFKVPDDTIISVQIDAVPGLAQVDDITVATVLENTIYSISVGNTYYQYDSGDNPTNITIAAGLFAILDGMSIATVANNLDGSLTFTGPDYYTAINYSITSNMFIQNTTEATEPVAQVNAIWTDNEINGRLECTLSAAKTALLNVSRGPAEDGYYLKPGYQGTIDIEFTDGTLPIGVLIDRIYVSPTGGDCA